MYLEAQLGRDKNDWRNLLIVLHDAVGLARALARAGPHATVAVQRLGSAAWGELFSLVGWALIRYCVPCCKLAETGSAAHVKNKNANNNTLHDTKCVSVSVFGLLAR